MALQWKWWQRATVTLAGAFLLAQAYQPDRTPAKLEPKFSLIESQKVPADIKQTLQTACMDCHSGRPHWPWYGYISPVSWWLAGHIKEASLAVNFDTVLKDQPESVSDRLGESCDQMRGGQMPSREYKWMHADARLSKEQIDRFCKFAVGWE